MVFCGYEDIPHLANEAHSMNRWIASDKSSRIPISTFQTALSLHKVKVDEDEVECMVANMIFRVSVLVPVSLLLLLLHQITSIFPPTRELKFITITSRSELMLMVRGI
jgi:hypothetical protein